MQIVSSSLDFKISYHFILKSEICLGSEIHEQFQKEYKKSDILYWSLKPNSRLRKHILSQWPITPMIDLLHGNLSKKKTKIVIWVPQFNHNITNKEIKRYRKNRYKEFECCIIECMKTNNLHKLANTSRKLYGALNKILFQTGATNATGDHLFGSEADKCFVNFLNLCMIIQNQSLF